MRSSFNRILNLKNRATHTLSLEELQAPFCPVLPASLVRQALSPRYSHHESLLNFLHRNGEISECRKLAHAS